MHVVRFARLPVLVAGVSACAVVVFASAAHAAQGPVGLGTADSYGVLAGSGITNTGATTITGDIGTFPTPSETGLSSVTLHGTDHAGDAVTQGAKSDLVTAYNDAAGRNPATSVPVELGGTTLLPGVYTSPTFGLTGTLTLDAQGDPSAEFIFQAGSTLITASNSRVLVINGAMACDVVWQVGSSATFGTGTQFVGNVLAHTSISANDSATFQGRLLARDGAVTLIHNTITRTTCAASTPTSSPTPTPSATATSVVGSTPTPTSSQPGSAGPTSTPTSAPTSTTGSGHPSPTPPTSGTSSGPAHPGQSATPTPTATRSSPEVKAGGGGGTTGSGSVQTTPQVTPTLPFTGLPTRRLVEVALILLSVGMVMVVAGRRRRAVEGDQD